MKEIDTKRNISWNDIEKSFAGEVISKAKAKTRKWFAAWIITMALLILSNLLWYLAYNM